MSWGGEGMAGTVVVGMKAGLGADHLGKLLVRVREEIRDERHRADVIAGRLYLTEGPIQRYEDAEPCECWCGCKAATNGERCSACEEECRSG